MEGLKIQTIKVKDYLTKSNLPSSDYVINPYVGCMHGCKYCYAYFMKRFSGHDEEWGEFLDVKLCDKKIDISKLEGKSLFIASVTDCYNPAEREYKVTRKILEELVDANCEITITTKSALVTRDIDIIKRLKNACVAISINTLDERFKDDMDKASSISERIETLRIMHEEGIKTVVFMSPIFPGITNFREIILKTKEFTDEYWFENLNLRGTYKSTIMSYIKKNYPDLFGLYVDIYLKDNKNFWGELSSQIDEFCKEQKVNYKNYFYHEEIRKNN